MKARVLIAAMLMIPAVFPLSMIVMHAEGGKVVAYFSDNDNPVSVYSANATVRNSTHELKYAMSVSKVSQGLYLANATVSLPYGVYDLSVSVSNGTDYMLVNYSENQEFVVHKPGTNFRLVFNISVSSDPSFDSSYFDGSSEGGGEVRYMYSGNSKVFALVFPESPASLQRTPYSIMSVNSSLVYISFGDIGSFLDGFSRKPGISIRGVPGKGKYRVSLARDDISLDAEFCSAGYRKIVMENRGVKDGKARIRVRCI